jgi:hypothetical protein
MSVALDELEAVSETSTREEVRETSAAPDRIGRVVSVAGAQVICLLDKPQHDVGEGEALQIGSLVKLAAHNNTVFGMVGGLSIPIPSRDGGNDLEIIEVELIGEMPPRSDGTIGSFRRGVSKSPGLRDLVFAASEDELRKVYERRSDSAVEIGGLQQNPGVPAYAVVDDLLGKHFSIVGTTGSGKSCAVALILHSIINKHPNSHIVLLDPHAEYAHAFGDVAESIEPDELLLPHWLFTFEEFVEIVFGNEADELVAETTILRELIQKCKVRFMGVSEQARMITVDTPVPYKVGDMMRLLDQTMGRLENRNALAPYHRVKARLVALQSDRRFSFMFPATVVVRDNLAEILSQIFRVPVDGKPISIVNLSGIPSEVLNVVVSVLCRMTFDFALWSDQRIPLLLVCEEAHRYAPSSGADGFEPTKRALSRIAKEGRKYGISLGVITQRPSELTTNVLSQCNTMFAMRMTSEKDQDYLRAAMSEATSGLLGSLPSLGNGEAIAVGEGVVVPMRLVFSELPEDKRPKSSTAKFSDTWREGDDSMDTLAQVVSRWRQLDPV